MEYRGNGIGTLQGHIALILGRVASRVMEEFYSLQSVDVCMATYERLIDEAVTNGEIQVSEKWATEAELTKAVIKKYVTERTPTQFGEIIAVQHDVRMPDFPCHVKLDLLTKRGDAVGTRIIDQKTTSGWTDIEFENMKYELGSQPGLYPAAVQAQGYPGPYEMVIDYLIKGKPASGRYKATEPELRTYSFDVEPWAIDMAMASATEANNGMVALWEGIQQAGGVERVEMKDIPRRVINCIKSFGMKKYPCDFYVPCSHNAHPMSFDGLFIEGRR